MTFLSIDIGSTKSGIAKWHNGKLRASFVVKPCGNKGAYWLGGDKVSSKFTAWEDCVIGVDKVIMERGAGHRPNVINGQAKLRGYIEAICEQQGVKHMEVNVSEWKRVIKEDQDISWPKDSARQKALAIQLVKDLYSKEVTEDEADAILLGHASLRLGYVQKGVS